MKNFIKKYWPHILNISSIVYLICIFKFLENVVKNEVTGNPPTQFMVILIIEFVIVIGIWAEIIYFIIKATKSTELENKGLHIAGIYLLNLFYIPCFNLKYIHKDNKARLKNIIYVLTTICLFVIFSVYMLKFQTYLYSYESYVSDDKVISVTVPSDYSNNIMVGKYDMYFKKDSTFNIGIFLYNDIQEGADDIMNAQENSLSKIIKNFEIIDESTQKQSGKNITTHVYKGRYNGIANCYYISTITFDKKQNYIVCVIGTSLENSKEENEKEYNDFIRKLTLNQK